MFLFNSSYAELVHSHWRFPHLSVKKAFWPCSDIWLWKPFGFIKSPIPGKDRAEHKQVETKQPAEPAKASPDNSLPLAAVLMPTWLQPLQTSSTEKHLPNSPVSSCRRFCTFYPVEGATATNHLLLPALPQTREITQAFVVKWVVISGDSVLTSLWC